MAVLPPLLAWAMHLVDRFRCAQTPTATPVPVVRLLGLSYLALLTHPALDWLNTYGIRLLMPFDGRWFYGDSLFIVDPWVWLMLGTIVVLAHSASRILAAGWIALGAIATALVTGVPGVPFGLRVFWCLGLAMVAGLRVWGGLQPRLQRVATSGLVLAGIYVLAMVGSSQLVRLEVERWARDRGLEANQIMVGPTPADPFRRSVVMADDQHYHRLAFDWLASERVQLDGGVTTIGDDHPAAGAALSAPALWGLATWTRFPSYTIEALPDGYRVGVTDIRFGRAVVELDRDLNPR
jgi:inner membrane protein